MTENQRLIAGRYQVGELIGRGGMAEVYKGVDTRLGREVAIKLLKSDLANDPNFESRFRQEAQSSARMAHPTIVRVYDAGEDETIDAYNNVVKRPYIVMEYVRGTVLRDLMHSRRLTVEEAIDYAEGVLTALETSHRAGIVHRDIKSANIMITETGVVKVMDFGIARIVSEGTATQAHTTGIVGTAQYFSPEQARGETVDFRSDLYSTGVLLYEMLAGQPPFRGETAVSVAYQHVSEAVVPPSTHNSLISAELDEVVLRALAKNKDDRFQSAEEFREHLLAAVGVTRERVSTQSMPLQIIETNPMDDFDALLRGANSPLPEAAEVVVQDSSLAAVEPIIEIAQPSNEPVFESAAVEPESNLEQQFQAQVEPEPTKPAPTAFDALLAGETKPAEKPIIRPEVSASAQTTVFENPFAEIGVEFPTAPNAQVLTESQKDRSPAAPPSSIIWGVVSGLVVLITGLAIWFVTVGGSGINITPPSLGIAVADVVNKPYEEAYATLTAQKLAVQKVYEPSETVPAETVISSEPVAGTRLAEKSVVVLHVSSGKGSVQLQDLSGMKEADARAALEAANLKLGLITVSTSAKYAKGVVISSDPVAGTSVLTQSTVNLTVSNGKVNVPNVVNLSVDDATAQLTAEDVGLAVSVATEGDCSGTLGTTVTGQSISPGLTAQGSTITLFVACQP